MSESVQRASNIILNYLNKYGPTTVSTLTRQLPGSQKSIQRGIGWLAREDKVTIDIINRAETLSVK
jgi:hypothetical protein